MGVQLILVVEEVDITQELLMGEEEREDIEQVMEHLEIILRQNLR